MGDRQRIVLTPTFASASNAATYVVTIGSETYSSRSVAYDTDDATTAAAVRAARAATGATRGQTVLQDLGITLTAANQITLTYADSENVAETNYAVTATGTGTASVTSGTITDGVNTAAAITTIDAALDIVAVSVRNWVQLRRWSRRFVFGKRC